MRVADLNPVAKGNSLRDIHDREYVFFGVDLKGYHNFVPSADDPRQLHRGPYPHIYRVKFRQTLEARFPGWAFPEAPMREDDV